MSVFDTVVKQNEVFNAITSWQQGDFSSSEIDTVNTI